MTTPDELLRLAERVEQGSGEDTALVTEIFHAVDRVSGSAMYLTSLDAVEALRQRLLPGSDVEITRLKDDVWSACVGGWLTSAETEPRARLAALLRALAGKEA